MNTLASLHIFCQVVVSGSPTHAASEADNDHPQGNLRLTAPIWCANPVFARWMGGYRERFPAVSLDIILNTNGMRDFVSEDIDLALRVSKSPVLALVVPPLFTVQFVLVASTACLHRHGVPQTPLDAAAHQGGIAVVHRCQRNAVQHGWRR